MNLSAAMTVCLQKVADFRCVSNKFISSYLLHSVQTHSLTSPLKKRLNQSALMTSWTPKTPTPTLSPPPSPPNIPLCSRASNETSTDSDVCSQGSTDSLPHCARSLCRPLLEENCEPTQTNKLIFFFPPPFCPSIQLVVAPTWS